MFSPVLSFVFLSSNLNFVIIFVKKDFAYNIEIVQTLGCVRKAMTSEGQDQFVGKTTTVRGRTENGTVMAVPRSS